MRRGFTLMELIIVIIILGILATIGFNQYSKMIEKGRTAEAKAILGQIRTAEEGYFLENNQYIAGIDNLPIAAPTACAPTHYFTYDVVGGGPGFVAIATRCMGGGKIPDATIPYDITLNEAGVWGGTAGYF